ncbi:hypothetical protein MC885_021815 [Smutsia gigantea]|nr:hypothetical protein MC885_021815 [Smutsia gigantea]
MLLLLGLCLGLPLCAAPSQEAPSRGGPSERIELQVPRQVRLLQRLKTKPLMTEFSVKSTIIARYAFTTVSCRMLNRASADQEIGFQMQIPDAAFITNFTMLIGDKVYQGEITEREKKNGDKVKEKRNQTAEDNGEQGIEMFRASAVIPSKAQAVFLLSYEELLQRRLGKYEHAVSVRPQQLVGRLTVEVDVLERSGIRALEVLQLQTSRRKGGRKGAGEWGQWVCVDLGSSEQGGASETLENRWLRSNKGSECLWDRKGGNKTKTVAWTIAFKARLYQEI